VSRLFISLFLDEDVDVLLATLLKSQNWSARTVKDEGREGIADPQQLEFAAKNQMTILTHNRNDYEELAAQWLAEGRMHSGIIIAIRRHSTYDLARRLIVLLNSMTADEMDNQVFYI